MGMTLTRKWSLVAFVAILAVFAAGWFLLISPKRGEAADLKSKTQAQQGTNAGLLQQLAILKVQQADLPTKQAALAELGQQIPDNPALPGLIRNLTSASRQSGVSLDELSPALPVPLAGPVAAAPVAPPADATSAATTDTSATDTAPAPVVAAAPAPTLYQVPLVLKVSGSFFELEQFVNKLEGLKRSFLVTGFTIAPITDTTTTGTAAGDLVLTLQGRVFLAPPATAPAPTTPVAPATTGQ
jgi:Tfp pilus assembly protein PilO